MKISFLGHSFVYDRENILNEIKGAIKNLIKENEKTTFLCGGYGDFDNISLEACHCIKKDYQNCEIVFVTPYIIPSQKIKDFLEGGAYDCVIYPPLENVPLRFAIEKRNKWMIDQADIIVAYVAHTYGNSYKFLKYAEKKKKSIIKIKI